MKKPEKKDKERSIQRQTGHSPTPATWLKRKEEKNVVCTVQSSLRKSSKYLVSSKTVERFRRRAVEIDHFPLLLPCRIRALVYYHKCCHCTVAKVVQYVKQKSSINKLPANPTCQRCRLSASTASAGLPPPQAFIAHKERMRVIRVKYLAALRRNPAAVNRNNTQHDGTRLQYYAKPWS